MPEINLYKCLSGGDTAIAGCATPYVNDTIVTPGADWYPVAAGSPAGDFPWNVIPINDYNPYPVDASYIDGENAILSIPNHPLSNGGECLVWKTGSFDGFESNEYPIDSSKMYRVLQPVLLVSDDVTELAVAVKTKDSSGNTLTTTKKVNGDVSGNDKAVIQSSDGVWLIVEYLLYPAGTATGGSPEETNGHIHLLYEEASGNIPNISNMILDANATTIQLAHWQMGYAGNLLLGKPRLEVLNEYTEMPMQILKGLWDWS